MFRDLCQRYDEKKMVMMLCNNRHGRNGDMRSMVDRMLLYGDIAYINR